MDKVFSSKRNGTELCKISKLKKKGKILKEIVNANLGNGILGFAIGLPLV